MRFRPTNGVARFGFAWAFVLAVASWSPGHSRAQAQPPSQPQPQVQPQPQAGPTSGSSDARALFLQGEQAYRIGNYDDAVNYWQRAYAADARPRIQYNLSQAYERLGRLVEAVSALDSFVQATPPDDPLYGEASARLAALRQRVALTGIRIVGGPSGAQIFVDDQAWGATPRPDRIPVAPGNHGVVIVSPNGSRHEIAVAVPVGQVVDVNVPAGQDTVPTVTVSDVAGPQQQQQTFASPVPADQPHRSHSMLYAGAGVAGAGVLALLYGVGRQMALGRCSDPGFGCLHRSAVATERTLGLAVGVTLLAGGAALIVVDLVRPSSPSSAEVQLGVGTASLSLTVRR